MYKSDCQLNNTEVSRRFDMLYSAAVCKGDICAVYSSSGELLCRYVYDAWGNHKLYDKDGNQIDDDGRTIGSINPIRYRGYYWDREFGLYYLKSRYYDPALGRFISPDAVDYLNPQMVGGMNLYSYCLNNPVMGVDPDGTAWWNGLYNWTMTILGLLNPIGAIVSLGAIVVAAAQGRWDEVVEDWNNGCFNPFNQSADIALNSNVFSFYKGEYVIRQSFGESGSFQVFGTIYLNTNADLTGLNHEWGHGVQEKFLGGPYLLNVGLPSVITYWTLPNSTNYSKNYYSMPWERTADFLGGVNRGNYKAGSLVWGFIENIFGVFAIPFYFLFGY